MPTPKDPRQSRFDWDALRTNTGVGGEPLCKTPGRSLNEEQPTSAPSTNTTPGAPKQPKNVHYGGIWPGEKGVLPPVIEGLGNSQTQSPRLAARRPSYPESPHGTSNGSQALTAGEGAWKPLFDLALGVEPEVKPRIRPGDEPKSPATRRYTVAQTTVQGDLLLVQKMSAENAEMTLRITEKLKHKNLLARIQEFGGGEFIAWEFMPMSLLHLARSRFLNELSIASILEQVLDGLQALHDQRLEHYGLSCSTVLINGAGIVKICGLEHCREMEDGDHHAGVDGRGLKRLTLELVDGHYMENLNDNGNFQITNVHLDHLQNTVDFIDKLNGRVNISTLRQQKLFSLKGRPEILRGMIAYAQYFALFFKEYPSKVA